MKGAIFVDFIEMVEELYSYDMVDQIILDNTLASGGAYTAVGTYSHVEMLKLVTSLSKRTDIAVPDLVFAFGKNLFYRLIERYPDFIKNVDGSFSFVDIIESHIHQEVLKLYPDAELPLISASAIDDRTLVVIYKSTRPFADLAHGLLTACCEHFGEDVEIIRKELDGPPATHAEFTLTRK